MVGAREAERFNSVGSAQNPITIHLEHDREHFATVSVILSQEDRELRPFRHPAYPAGSPVFVTILDGTGGVPMAQVHCLPFLQAAGDVSR